MKKYYRLKLNCAKAEYGRLNEDDIGFVEIMPIERETIDKFLFIERKKQEVCYDGKFYIIAEQVNDHFEDIVLNKTIKYDPNGLKDIENASVDVLSTNLKYGISCYEYQEIGSEEVKLFLEMIKTDENMQKKYIKEIENVEKKYLVIEEIKNKLFGDYDKEKSKDMNIKKYVRVKSLN